MSKFKVGDRVRCVDASRLAHGILKRGAEYTVREIRPMRRCEDEVYLEGIAASWATSRFELIPAATPETQDLSPSQQIRQDAAEALAKVEAKRADVGPQSASPSSPGRVEAQARDAAKQLDEVDPVNHPPHYTQGDIECIDAIRAALTDDEFRGYCKGNAIKYVWRERHKGGDESVAKAKWYLDKMKGGE